MKKCPSCKQKKPNSEYNKGGSTTNSLCTLCQRVYNNNKVARQKQKILEWTNYGKCWWVYQSIMGDLSPWRKKK